MILFSLRIIRWHSRGGYKGGRGGYKGGRGGYKGGRGGYKGERDGQGVSNGEQ